MDCLALASTCYASATANPFQPPRLDNPLHCGDYDAHHHHQHQPHQHRPGMMPDSVETVGHVATTISEPHIDLGSKAAPAVRLLGPVDTPDTLTSEVPTSHARQRHTNPAVLPSIALKKGIDIERYKTQLCKTFRKTGQCPYFDRCMFAHGARELRTAEQNAQLVAEAENVAEHLDESGGKRRRRRRRRQNQRCDGDQCSDTGERTARDHSALPQQHQPPSAVTVTAAAIRIHNALPPRGQLPVRQTDDASDLASISGGNNNNHDGGSVVRHRGENGLRAFQPCPTAAAAGTDPLRAGSRSRLELSHQSKRLDVSSGWQPRGGALATSNDALKQSCSASQSQLLRFRHDPYEVASPWDAPSATLPSASLAPPLSLARNH